MLAESEVNKEEIVSIGIDGHMHAAVMIDKNGELLTHEAQLYCDKRNDKIVDDFCKIYNEDKRAYELVNCKHDSEHTRYPGNYRSKHHRMDNKHQTD